MEKSPPAPSLRELSSDSETEGVYYDVRSKSKVSEQKDHRLNRWPQSTNERHSLSQPLRAASSLIEGAGGLVPFIVPPGNRKVAGDFHRPYETLMILAFTMQRRTLPQSRPAGVPAPSEREPGGLCHSSGYSLKSQVAGDFRRPYETLMILAFTMQRTTLPQSRPLGVPAPS